MADGGFYSGVFRRQGAGGAEELSEFVNAVVGKEYESPLEDAVAECILGRQKFVEMIKELYLRETKVDRNVPAVRATL